jgi:hypothetical protein
MGLLSIGAPLGYLGGGVLLLEILRESERGLQKGSFSLCRRSVRGTWRGAPLLGIQKEMGRREQRSGITLHGVRLGSLEEGKSTGD